MTGTAARRAVEAVERAGRRLAERIATHARLLGDPESMVGAFIMTVWTVLAGAWGGWPAIVVFAVIGWLLHAIAVESGNHVALWLSTAALLIFVVVASAATFGGLPPVLLAAAGTTALVHNELVRLNHTRRRRAVIDDEVFHTIGLALTLAGVLAVVAVAAAEALTRGPERTWLWMPVAVGALMLVGLGLAVLPTRRAPEASRERWEPGTRIPPQPLTGREPERF